jgi:hypothetical protein
MKALTLMQVWPWAFPHKNVENRTWSPPRELLGQWFALHGGSVPAKLSTEQLRDWHFILKTVRENHPEYRPQLEKLATGKHFYRGIFAVARLAGVVTPDGSSVIHLELIDYKELGEAASGPWGFGPYRWVLDKVLMLPEPITCKGAQKLWDVDPFHEGRILGFLEEQGEF